MALPTGSGSEVLKRHSANVDDSSTTLTVPALHIYTILSINLTSLSASSSDVDIFIHDGSLPRRIADGTGATALGPKDTFVYSDRIVMMAGDVMTVDNNTAVAVDVWISYIDQDWTTP